MSANIKIGNDTLQGVDAVELENADALGSYVKFTLGVAGGYTVTFVAEGNPYSIISVTAGSAIKEPIPPEVTGTVQGWSTDEAGANLVSFPYTPTSDIHFMRKFPPRRPLRSPHGQRLRRFPQISSGTPWAGRWETVRLSRLTAQSARSRWTTINAKCTSSGLTITQTKKDRVSASACLRV